VKISRASRGAIHWPFSGGSSRMSMAVMSGIAASAKRAVRSTWL
jgi:hypothetical protein